jgi:Ca2+-binding EF-hand superfamily protein
MAAGLLVAAASSLPAEKKTSDARFARLDANSDGKLDKAELKAKRKDEAKADRAFVRIDANGDGSITKEEFASAADRRGKKAKRK